MANFIKYSGVNSKVKALFGKMLSNDDFRELLNASSVQQIFDYLYENTFYGQYLEDLTGIEIHRRKLERTLKKNVINDFEILKLYLTGVPKKFIKQFFVKFEIDDLKMLLRTILIEHDEDYLKENLVYLGVRHGISFDKLTKIKSYRDLLDVFEETPFYNTLERFEERYKRDKNLFPIEMTLDFEYFTDLAQIARHLSPDDYQEVRKLLGTQVDLLNINWIYRIKKFYDLELEEILNYTLPFHYNLSEEDLKGLAKLEDAEEVFDFLKNTKYDQLFSPVKEDESFLFEKYFLSYLLERARQVKASSSFNIGMISAYLFIKEYEIRDIITIVEGIRYSLNSEEISNYLIRDWI